MNQKVKITTEKKEKLTEAEQAELIKHRKTIEQSNVNEAGSFQQRADAFYQIQDKKLYRENYETEAAFFKKEFGYARSTALRMAREGQLLSRLSSMEDNVVKQFTSDRHLRSLLKLNAVHQDAAIALARTWQSWTSESVMSSQFIDAAVTVLHPQTPVVNQKETPEEKLVVQFVDLVADSKANLPAVTPDEVLTVFDNLEKKAHALGGPRRSTGIDWTEATWNPLQGCTRASSGCDNCYAAKLVATRLADVYPGLAKATKKNGKTTYAFTGKIQLLPAQLSKPLLDKEGKLYFVNSMSDLFHKNVKEEFIEAVFDVMEKAPWHTFQVLTKRPDRMAEFTKKRYAVKEPPSHIWLGTSTENQESFDNRYPHLIKTKAAVRWLSVEPLLGSITFGSLKDVDWVVVGGESGGVARRMDKTWATSIRDQCARAKVAFYFKQWGDFNEAGVKEGRKQKKDGLVPGATLDGVIHNAYPADKANAKGRLSKVKAPSLKVKRGAKLLVGKGARGVKTPRTVRTGLGKNFL
jgi:protein gp37